MNELEQELKELEIFWAKQIREKEEQIKREEERYAKTKDEYDLEWLNQLKRTLADFHEQKKYQIERTKELKKDKVRF